MNLSPAVSLQRSRDPVGRQVLIAGGGVALPRSLLALRAPTGGRVEVTVRAPDLKSIIRSIVGATPFDPQRVLGHRLEDTRRALGAWWECRSRNRIEHQALLAVVERQPVHNPEGERNQIMVRHLESQEQFVTADPTQGRQRGQRPGEDPTQGRRHGQRPGEDPTQGRQHGQRPGEDPTQGRQYGQRPGEDPMGGK